MPVALSAITVELNMVEMERQAFRGADGRERRLHIARHAEIAAMDVQWMHDAELLQRTRQRHDDVARRNVIIDVLLVEIELALIEFEIADTAGVHHLDRDRL